jgi:hypothetical protein
MKTEQDFGREFAEFISTEDTVVSQGEPTVQPDTNAEIPNEDYLSMQRSGIENPDARAYWMGYNSFFEQPA